MGVGCHASGGDEARADVAEIGPMVSAASTSRPRGEPPASTTAKWSRAGALRS